MPLSVVSLEGAHPRSSRTSLGAMVRKAYPSGTCILRGCRALHSPWRMSQWEVRAKPARGYSPMCDWRGRGRTEEGGRASHWAGIIKTRWPAASRRDGLQLDPGRGRPSAFVPARLTARCAVDGREKGAPAREGMNLPGMLPARPCRCRPLRPAPSMDGRGGEVPGRQPPRRL